MADLASQFPSTPSFTAVNFTINTPSQISNTLTGKIRRIGLGVSFYSWEVKYPPLIPLDAGTVRGFVAQALGPQFSFEIILPEISYTNLPNQTANTPVLSSAAAIGSTSVSLTNCGANGWVLAAGDYFKFANHSKVYQCVSPCQANAGGTATLYFSGPLVSAVPTSTQLTITATPFTAILASNEQSFEVGYGGMTNMSLSMREVW
jgi:hypothetical protein